MIKHLMHNIFVVILLVVCALTKNAFAANPNVDSVINDQIKNLTSRIETLEGSLSDLRKELADVKKNSATPSANKASETSQDTAAYELKPDVVVVPKDKQDYDLALALLKEGKFEQAEQQFAEFIRNHPESNLQSNANFWYAESFYRREMYNKAAVNYLKGYKQYPKGAKAADSLLKLSYTLNSLGKSKEACNMLVKLEKEFPNRSSDSINRASEAKAKFKCGK